MRAIIRLYEDIMSCMSFMHHLSDKWEVSFFYNFNFFEKDMKYINCPKLKTYFRQRNMTKEA